MVAITIKPIENKDDWERFLTLHEEANFLQSWYWGEFHKRLGKKFFRSGLYKEGKLVGAMLSIVESAKRGKYLTVPGGPIIDWTDKAVAHSVFDEMKRIARENNCIFVRVRPQLLESESSIKLFDDNSFRKSPMHLTADLTHQLDLTKTEEELMGDMRKATRYEVRKSEKLGINIEKSKDEKLIKKFYDLQLQTAKRQKFVPFGYNFLNEQFKVFSENDCASLFTAKLGNKILAQAFIIFYGSEAVYHYGVSTEEGRRYPGAYLIQWEAIKEAKRRGMKKYNFWGVAPVDSKNHRFAGVSLFKRGFGGVDVAYLHAQDLIVERIRYLLVYLFEILRKIHRGV